MWAARQSRVILLYLPAQGSHVLQPLDLAGFNFVKGKFRWEINDLATLDDAAPINKYRLSTATVKLVKMASNQQ